MAFVECCDSKGRNARSESVSSNLYGARAFSQAVTATDGNRLKRLLETMVHLAVDAGSKPAETFWLFYRWDTPALARIVGTPHLLKGCNASRSRSCRMRFQDQGPVVETLRPRMTIARNDSSSPLRRRRSPRSNPIRANIILCPS